ncbi:hypothetical protein ACFV20_19180 [Streptomyces sp. NPDC059696]|uniref:hypothetical protein n=1 Tax=Streptomyces sp. NPDC059696 TaxID=3346911 RepID=UPI0036CD5B71
MPIAPLVAAVRRRLTNLPGPLRGSGEASNDEPVQVELFIAGEWVDITNGGYVMVRDDSGQIRITYGIQGGEGSQTDSAQATLQLKNGDGRFSPRNPSGPYYGLIGRNTPLRISVPDGNGGKSYRMWGEVTEWAPNWDPTGNDVWVDVTDKGIMQRLAQGPGPERSVIYYAVTDPTPSNLVAYWPCEDASDAVQIASALANGSPMTFTVAPQLAASTRFEASDPLPVFTGAAMSGGVAKYSNTTATQVRFLLYIPPEGTSDRKVILRVSNFDDITVTQAMEWELVYNTTGRNLSLQLMDGDGANFNDIADTLPVPGRLLRVSIEAQEVGSNTNYTLRLLDLVSGAQSSGTGTRTSEGLTRVTKISPFVPSISVVGPNNSTGLTGGVIGHITVQNEVTAIDDLGTRLNTIGETAGRRIERLCGEEGIPFEWVGDLDDTVALGGQPRQNPLSLMQEACLADGGLLYETRSVLGLGYRTRASLYNQDPALTLSYTGYNLAQVPVPVEDDRYVQNVLTVTVGGVSATYEETDGALGTETVGKYGETSGLTLNLATTDRATIRDHAAWRVHLGTVDEERFPRISVNLAHSSITPAMKRAILALRLGDRIQVTSPPSWLAPDTIDQLVLGIEETITHFEHRLTFACAPASPYSSIGVLDAAETRIDTDGSELVAAVSSAATSLTVVPSAGEVTLWTTSSADWPFDVRVGGEVMRVTGVSDWLSDTFTRSVSGSWGTPDTGSTWSTVGGGSASDYSVNGSVGVHTLATLDTSRRTAVTAVSPDFDLYCDITTSALATGSSLYGAVTGRMQDSGNMYTARLEFTTGNAVLLDVRRIVADVQTSLGSYTVPVTHAAGQFVRVRFRVIGSAVKGKAWLATGLEPPEWHVAATDSSFSAAYSIGTRSIRTTGSTNAASVAIQYDNFRVISPQTFTVTRSVNGVVKAHSAGADVRLANPTILAL